MNYNLSEEWVPYIRGGVIGFAIGISFVIPAFIWFVGKFEGAYVNWYKIFSK